MTEVPLYSPRANPTQEELGIEPVSQVDWDEQGIERVLKLIWMR